MLPLAILSGLLVGVALPAVYSYGLSAERLHEANTLAKQLAGRLSVLVAERPRLWMYDLDRIDGVVRPLSETLKEAQVSIQTAREPNAYRLGQETLDGEVTGWAGVYRGKRIVARIAVQLSDARVRSLSRNAWLVAGALGFVLAVTLFFLPVFTVRRGDAVNNELWSALEASNTQLESRVEARTAALEATLQGLQRN